MDLTPYQSYLDSHRDELLKATTPDAFDILDDVLTVLNMHQIYIGKKSTSRRKAAQQIVDILIYHQDKAKQFLGCFEHKKRSKTVAAILKAALKEAEKESKERSTIEGTCIERSMSDFIDKWMASKGLSENTKKQHPDLFLLDIYK